MNMLIDTNVISNMIFKRTGYEEAFQLFRKIRECDSGAFITIYIKVGFSKTLKNKVA